MTAIRLRGRATEFIMAITENEAARLIDIIEKAVRDAAREQEKSPIIGIIDQWRSDVEAGRPVERKVKVSQSPGLDVIAEVPRSRAVSSGDFVGKEDFTTIEQLDMLIAALGIAFIAPQMMANRFVDALTAYSSPTEDKKIYAPQIHLTSDIDKLDVDRGPAISRDSIAQSREKTDALGALLAEISKEAGFELRKFTNDRKVDNASSP